MRPTLACLTMDAGTRALTAALNKLSDRNYTVMCTRVCDCLATSSVRLEDVIGAVLTKCYHEDCYAALYVRMLSDIAAAYGESLNEPANDGIVANEVRAFVDAFVNTDIVEALPVPTHDASYDEFCHAVKTRKHMVGKNRTILALLKRGFVHHRQPDGYADALCALLEAACRSGEAHIEAVLGFIADFAKMFPSSAAKCLPSLRSTTAFLNEQDHTGMKCRFRMMDVMQACGAAAAAAAAVSDNRKPAGRSR